MSPAPFAVAARLLAPAAGPHIGPIIAGFEEADLRQLDTLETIIGGIDPDGPVCRIVESLVAQAYLGEPITARDVSDVAAEIFLELDKRLDATDAFTEQWLELWRPWQTAMRLKNQLWLASAGAEG